MSNAFSLRCIYLSCKVLYFILSDDDFEIKSKILIQFQPASCFEAYLAFSRCLFSEFAFYFMLLNLLLPLMGNKRYEILSQQHEKSA